MQYFSRRRFMAVTGGACAAAAGASLLPSSAWPETTGFAPGIQLYGVAKALEEDTPGVLKQLRAFGYTEVETAGFAELSAKEFRAMLDDAGLVCPSAHMQLAGADLDAQFADAYTLGAHFAVSGSLNSTHYVRLRAKDGQPGDPTLVPTGLGGFTNLAAKMNEVGKKAGAAGLQYAYHNHNFEFEKMADGTTGYDQIIQQTDPDLVKFEIDCGWMEAAGSDPVAYFQRYPGRFVMLHIKDFKPVLKPTLDTEGPNAPGGVNLGTGFIDYRRILNAGKTAGLRHIFVEQEQPYPISEMDSAQLDYVALEKLLR